MKEGGGREEEPGIKLLPMPGLLASSAPCEGGVLRVCGGVLSARQAPGAEQTGQGWGLRPVGEREQGGKLA